MGGIGSIATSGMNAAMSDMQEISNNIANVNTIGFKQAMVDFADVNSGGTGSCGSASSGGMGVKVLSISQDFSPGQTEITNQCLDVSINGSGFFIQRDPISGLTSYTRAGRFSLDDNGYILGLNGRIQGFPVINGQVSATGLVDDLKVPQLPAVPTPTSKVSMQLNLNSNSTAPANTPFSSTDSTTYNYRTDSTLYDSLGTSNILSVFYVKDAVSSGGPGITTWTAYGYVNGNQVATGSIGFSASGLLDSTTGLDSISWTPSAGAATPPNLTINLTGSTHMSTDHQVTLNEADGNPAGTPTGFFIDTSGKINVHYSNGQTIIKGQLALANFKDPGSLARSENMSWVPTLTSGTPIINASASANAFMSGTIESSNVDLTSQLVRLLNSQHNFQANAQVEQTYSQVLQTVEKL